MSQQTGLGDFGTEPPSDPFDFDAYGPTSNRPLPTAEEEREPWKECMRSAGFSPDVLREEAFHGGWPDRVRADNEPRRSFADELDAAGVDVEALAELRRIDENEAAAAEADAIEPDGAEAVTDGGERENLVYDCERCGETHGIAEDGDGYGLMFCQGTTIAYYPDDEPTEVDGVRPESAEPEPATDGGEVIEPDREPIAPVADTDELPSNEPVRLYSWVTGVMSTPSIIEGETSGSGKTIEVTDPVGDHRTFRLDTEEILAGECEFRDSLGFALYTPGEYRATQRANHAPGPQAGANEITPTEDLPNPTHFPEGSDEHAAVCQCCGHAGRFRTKNMKDPRCHACGAIDEEVEADR